MDAEPPQIKVFQLCTIGTPGSCRTDDGVKREVRVIKTGGSWRFQSKRADEERWTYYDEPLVADLEEFREILFRKYQRRRASYEDVLMGRS